MPLKFRSTLEDSEFEAGLRRMESATRRTSAIIAKSFEGIGGGGLGSFLGGGTAGGAYAAGIYAIAKAGDSAANAMARLTVATGDQEKGLMVFERLKALALDTGISIEESSAQFARFAIASRQIGATNDEVVKLIRLMGQAGAISGSTTEEASAAATQLGQALASGRFQGDELRSIMENMPILAEALANKLGVSVGMLRQMGKDGELTTDKVFPALLASADELDKKFREMPVSLSRAWAVFKTEVSQGLAQADEATGIGGLFKKLLTGGIPALQKFGFGLGKSLAIGAGPVPVPEGAVTEGSPVPVEVVGGRFNQVNPDTGDPLAAENQGAASSFGKDWAQKGSEAIEKVAKEEAEKMRHSLNELNRVFEQIRDAEKKQKIRTLESKLDTMNMLQERISGQMQREVNFNLSSPDQRRSDFRSILTTRRAESRANRERIARQQPGRRFHDARAFNRELGGDLNDVNISDRSIKVLAAEIQKLIIAP